MPKHSKEIWVAAFNAAYKDCESKDKKDCESYAFAVAYAAVKKNTEESKMSKLQQFMQSFRRIVARKIKDVEKWDGSASNYKDTAAYCRACLIDVNTGDTKDQAHCMLPVKEDGDSAYVRQAIHAAAGGHGISQIKKPADVSQDTWDAAVKAAANKMLSAYDEMGEDAPESLYKMAGKEMPERSTSISNVMGKVWEQIEDMGMSPWITDVYFDGPQMFVIIADKGKLYRADVTVGEGEDVTVSPWVEVKIDFPPAEVEMSRNVKPVTVVRQMGDGKYRWISISCSAVLNKNGEIDSRALFDSFIAHAEETGEYPIRQFYHSGETFRTGQADFVGRDGYLLITSGLYDDTEIARAEVKARQTNPDYWGDSIGFLAAQPEMVKFGDISIPVYETGILREISTLPEAEACAWMTATPIVMEVNMERTLSDRQFAAFVKLFDDDEAAASQWLDEHSESRNRAIIKDGMVTRQTEHVTPEPVVEEVATVEVTNSDAILTVPVTVENREFVLDEAAIGEITRRVLAGIPAPELPAEVVSGIGELNSALAALQDEVAKIANRTADVEGFMATLREDMPPAKTPTTTITYRPRQAAVTPVTPAVENDGDEMNAAERAAAIMQSKKIK